MPLCMERKIAVESPAAGRGRLLVTYSVTSPGTDAENGTKAKNGKSSCSGSRMGEAAGGCTAICCCCPCAVMHFVILAVYHLPTALWRRKKRKRLLKRSRENSSSEKEMDRRTRMSVFGFYVDDGDESSEGEEYGTRNDAVDWDNEMWDRFNQTGFWRSLSQRNEG